MAPVKSRAIVLRTHRLRETSGVIVCYTEAYGKVRLVAKGVRKGGGRLGAALEPFVVSGVVFYLRDGRDLSLVSNAEIMREFPSLRRDPLRMGYAAVALELVERLVPDRDPDAALFALLEKALGDIDGAPGGRLDPILWDFELAVAERLGYEPVLAPCTLCGEPGRPDAGFAPSVGGVVCVECARARSVPSLARGPAAGLLLRFARDRKSGRLSLWDLPPEAIDPELGYEVAELLRRHLEAHSDRRLRLNSMSYLAQMKRLDPAGQEPGRHDEE